MLKLFLCIQVPFSIQGSCLIDRVVMKINMEYNPSMVM